MHDPYLKAMGIEQWVRREPQPLLSSSVVEDKHDVEHVEAAMTSDEVVLENNPAAAATPDIELTPTQSRESHNVDGLDWAALESAVADCTVCDLHATRSKTVFGAGDRQADWMLIGEAPGSDEDSQGEPFVGAPGELLSAMLQAMGLQRKQVYITNILKCRLPEKRDPLDDEVQCCEPYLRRQIELVQPKIILAIGRVAAQNLLDCKDTMKDMRGNRFEYANTGIPVVATYHPSYLLHKPSEKRKSWQDLQFAMSLFAESDKSA